MCFDFPHRAIHLCSALAVAVLLSSCTEGSGEDVGATADAAPSSGSDGASASCIADYAESPCELLTAELVQTTLPAAPTDLEQSSYSGSMFSVCTYSWPSDRTGSREVMGRTVEYEENNSVGLSWIKTYDGDDPGAEFRREYLPTDAEVERGREMMQETLDERVAEGEMTEDERAVAEGLTESVAGGLSFVAVEGVGDLASWGGGTLHVLDGTTAFQVDVDISADADEDRQAAIAVANALMGACR